VNPTARAVIAALVGRGESLATAESLTGGMIGMLLTTVPGASAVYRGGLITYATDLKHTLAHVSAATLEAYGPVAAETAGELARGAADRCGSDWGLAVTGVAGPEPQDGHPVGQVFVGLADPGGTVESRELSLSGDRDTIRRQTAEAALRALLGRLD
jgi:nicotinamide-nucleotide amidase